MRDKKASAHLECECGEKEITMIGFSPAVDGGIPNPTRENDVIIINTKCPSCKNNNRIIIEKTGKSISLNFEKTEGLVFIENNEPPEDTK